MTLDDDNSIYVGGIPYECTETQLRRAFELYGSIIAVKIINDRAMGGKCYGFVTFTNPRSSTEAINEMDGRTIGGRVVRVNEVRNKGAGGRFNDGREISRRNQRGFNQDRGRGGGKEDDYDLDWQHNHPRDHGRERESKYYRSRSRDHSRDHFQSRDQDKSRDTEEWEQLHSRNYDRGVDRNNDLDGTQDRQVHSAVDHDRFGDKNTDCHKRKNSSSSYDQQSREPSSESDDHYHRMEEQLDLLIKKRDELQKEKYDMEQNLEGKKQLIADLQKRSMKLEDSLTSAKKLSSRREMQLTKLYKGFQKVNEYGERLKSSEQELQDLVESFSTEIDAGSDLGTRNMHLMNGQD